MVCLLRVGFDAKQSSRTDGVMLQFQIGSAPTESSAVTTARLGSWGAARWG